MISTKWWAGRHAFGLSLGRTCDVSQHWTERHPVHGYSSSFTRHGGKFCSNNSSIALGFSTATISSTQSRTGQWARRWMIATVGLGCFVGYDYLYNAQTWHRNLYTLYTGLMIAFDYTFRLEPKDMDSVERLHERNASRILQCCERNGGLFTKAGQAIGVQSAILPKPYQVLAKLFDCAQPLQPGVAERVIEHELGKSIHDLFQSFDSQPMAAASIAQVHHAVLKDGTEVAVKVQRPEIRKQAYWDLLAFRVLLQLQEKMFDLPFAFTGRFITQELCKETFFTLEAKNAQAMAKHVQSDEKLRRNVYVPRVYLAMTTDQVMVMEYIAGAHKLTDKLAHERDGLSITSIMDLVVRTFAAQMFIWGCVQCDPHPSNVLVRKHPKRPTEPQIVLIDHGSVIHLDPLFRHQYCDLWKAIAIADLRRISEIGKSWGIGNIELFTTATTFTPGILKNSPEMIAKTKERENMTDVELQQAAKAALRSFLVNTEALPLELLFMGRSTRIIQANNQALGSPVNRLKINAIYAAAGAASFPSQISQRSHLQRQIDLVWFRTSLLGLDVVFWLNNALRFLRNFWHIGSTASGGFEDDLERQIQRLVKSEAGIQLGSDAFSG